MFVSIFIVLCLIRNVFSNVENICTITDYHYPIEMIGLWELNETFSNATLTNFDLQTYPYTRLKTIDIGCCNSSYSWEAYCVEDKTGIFFRADYTFEINGKNWYCPENETKFFEYFDNDEGSWVKLGDTATTWDGAQYSTSRSLHSGASFIEVGIIAGTPNPEHCFCVYYNIHQERDNKLLGYGYHHMPSCEVSDCSGDYIMDEFHFFSAVKRQTNETTFCDAPPEPEDSDNEEEDDDASNETGDGTDKNQINIGEESGTDQKRINTLGQSFVFILSQFIVLGLLV